MISPSPICNSTARILPAAARLAASLLVASMVLTFAVGCGARKAAPTLGLEASLASGTSYEPGERALLSINITNSGEAMQVAVPSPANTSVWHSRLSDGTSTPLGLLAIEEGYAAAGMVDVAAGGSYQGNVFVRSMPTEPGNYSLTVTYRPAEDQDIVFSDPISFLVD